MTENTYEKPAAAFRRANLFLFLIHAFRVVFPNKPFAKADYLEALCLRLQEVAEGRNLRLVVNMPPRYLKSFVAAVVLPAWMLGRYPGKQILVATYGEVLAREHSALFRTLISSGYYKATFPEVNMGEGAGRMHEVRTGQGGGRRAVTTGGAVTGLGADIIIVDDVMKTSDVNSDVVRAEVRNFLDATLLSRLNDKQTGAVIAIQQRLHQDDLPAHLLEKDGYTHLNLPAIATHDMVHRLYHNSVWTHVKGTALCPARESLDVLAQIRADMGDAVFQTQYQQDPVAGGSSMVDASRLHLIDGLPDSHRRLRTVQTWDTAVKDNPDCDFSTCATFGWDGERWLLIDMVRERLDFGNLKARAVQLQARWNSEAVFVEDSANGTAVVQDLRRAAFLEFKTLGAREPKTARFGPAAEWLHDGRIGILHQCPWFPGLRQELLAFPNTRFDDQVDAISLFVKHQRSRRTRAPDDVHPKRTPDPRDLAKRQRLQAASGVVI